MCVCVRASSLYAFVFSSDFCFLGYPGAIFHSFFWRFPKLFPILLALWLYSFQYGDLYSPSALASFVVCFEGFQPLVASDSRILFILSICRRLTYRFLFVGCLLMATRFTQICPWSVFLLCVEQIGLLCVCADVFLFLVVASSCAFWLLFWPFVVGCLLRRAELYNLVLGFFLVLVWLNQHL